MPKYIVSTMIQSAHVDNNEPVQVRWYTGDSLAQAIAAMTSAAAHHEEVTENTSIPTSTRYSTLGVTLSIEQGATPSADDEEDRKVYERLMNAGATPSAVNPEFDCEDGDYALDDCVYWGTSSDECAGPRVGVRTSTSAVVCEKHFNHPPKN